MSNDKLNVWKQLCDFETYLASPTELTLALREAIGEVERLKKANAELSKDSAKLAALEASGVDNWEWYGEAMQSLRGEEEEEEEEEEEDEEN